MISVERVKGAGSGEEMRHEKQRHRENVASNAITIKDREAERKAVTNNH